MEAFQTELIDLAMLLILACVGYATKKVTKYLNSKGLIHKLENNKALVQIVVGAIEQTYKHHHGEQKLNLAKVEVVKLMKANKIKISETEIDLLIENVVKEMNDAYKKNK